MGLFDCRVNADVFHGWVEQVLLPELPRQSVIVMDNATFHKRQDTEDLLNRYGHQILWLPPDRPDFNPIEQMWAWVKRKRKEWLIDSIDILFQMFFQICMTN